MTKAKHIDPELLIQKDAEIASLEQCILDLKNQHALDTEDLVRRLKCYEQMLFGSRSEKRKAMIDADGQVYFDFLKDMEVLDVAEQKDEPEEDQPKSGKKKKKKAGSLNRLVFPEGLEVEDVRIDIPEDEKIDPLTGKSLALIGENIIEKLAITPATHKIIRFIQPVYGAGKSGVVKMELPENIPFNCMADASLISDCMVKRFCDHLPFYRQCQIYARNNFHVSRQTLDKWFLDTSKALTPLFILLKEVILKSPAIHVDETPVKLLVKGKGKAHQAYMWVLCGSPPGTDKRLVWMHFADNRRHENAKILIGDYAGVVHSDAYEAYEVLAALDVFIWAPCLVHARRKFIDATEGPIRDKAIDLMSQMMKNEKDARENHITGEALLKMRKNKQGPIFEELVEFLELQQVSIAAMTSKSLGGAIAYFLKRKDSFRNFITNEHALMDNNHAENAIRPLAIGRKNWLFAGSKNGGESAAGMYSLLLSCKNLGINPQEYLEDVMRNLPYTAKEDLINLLPHKWAPKKHPRSPYLPANYPG
jgi:transposase